MRQNIQLQPEYHSAFLESALSEYFRHAGDRFAEESAVFSTAVRCVLASEGHLSNKAIILWLIQTLESTTTLCRQMSFVRPWKSLWVTPWTISKNPPLCEG